MSVVKHINEAAFPTPLMELESGGATHARVVLKAEYLAPLGNLEDRWFAPFSEGTAPTDGEVDARTILSPAYTPERVLGLAQIAATTCKNVRAVTQSETKEAHRKVLDRFGSNETVSKKCPLETSRSWSSATLALKAIPEEEHLLLGNLGSLVDEVVQALPNSELILHLPYSAVRNYPESALLHVKNAAPLVTLKFIWWPASRWDHPPQEETAGVEVVRISRDDALLMTWKLGQSGGILATLPTGATVFSAMQSAATSDNDPNQIHVAVGCRFYDREENHNPLAKSIQSTRRKLKS